MTDQADGAVGDHHDDGQKQHGRRGSVSVGISLSVKVDGDRSFQCDAADNGDQQRCQHQDPGQDLQDHVESRIIVSVFHLSTFFRMDYGQYITDHTHDIGSRII